MERASVRFQVPDDVNAASPSSSGTGPGRSRPDSRSLTRQTPASTAQSARKKTMKERYRAVPAAPSSSVSSVPGKRSTWGRKTASSRDSSTSFGGRAKASNATASTHTSLLDSFKMDADDDEVEDGDVPFSNQSASLPGSPLSMSSAPPGVVGGGGGGGGGGDVERVVSSFRGVTVPEYKGHLPRVGHTAVMYKRNVYLFGGINAKGQYVSHLYRHEKRSLQWEEVRGAGVVPTGRANHSSLLIDGKMYVFGGHKNLDVFDDLFCFNMDAVRWDRIGYEKSQGPGSCFLHTAVYVPTTHTMLVLGGFHQREHNMYLGHSFDVQNKVWSGIPGPAETNPQCLQLVTAAFHSPRDAVVVLGIVDDEDAASHDMNAFETSSASSVYLLNIHSFQWTKVTTTSSPESAVPFRLDLVWEHFMREFIMMGGFHDEAQGAWYFPLNLGLVEKALHGRSTVMGGRRTHIGSGASSSAEASRGGAAAARKASAKASQYGFFALNLSDLTWSIIPIAFPKKLLLELAAKNRELISERAIQEGAAAGQAPHRSSKGGSTASAARNAAAAASGLGTGGRQRSDRVSSISLGGSVLDGMGSQFHEHFLQSSSPLHNAMGDPPRTAAASQRAVGAGRSGGGAGAARQATTTTASAARNSSITNLRSNFVAVDGDVSRRFRKLLLFTVQGAPQFQRKYAYAVYRESNVSQKSKKVKPMKYLIMHGGLEPNVDYSMLMFTPVMTRADVYAVRHAGSSVSSFGWDDAEDSSQLGLEGADGDDSAADPLRNLFGDNYSEFDAGSVSLREDRREEDEGGAEAFTGSGGARGRGRRLSAFGEKGKWASGGSAGRRVSGNSPEFNALAHAGSNTSLDIFAGAGRGNAVDDFLAQDAAGGEEPDPREECLLPILPCTRNSTNANRFAILYSSANSVRDTRLLPYANCPVAILENKKDVMKWSEQHYQDTRKWVAARIKTAVAEDKVIRRICKKRLGQLQQLQQHPHSAQASHRAEGLVTSSEDDSDDDSVNGGGASTSPVRAGRQGGDDRRGDQVTSTMDMVAAAHREEVQRREFVKDFFEKKGLDVFYLDEFLLAQANARAARVALSRGAGDSGASRAGGSPALDASLSLPSSAPLVERLRLNAKRREEQQRLPTAVFQQSGGAAAEANALTDLGSAMAYVLMHNALSALQADTSAEAASRRARIRWRFLRTLVRTGEAAFLIYRASQEASKMRAVKVTSTPGLLLAPELHLVGPTRAFKVPSRPVPYAVPRPAKQSTRYAELTPSGMVVYHNMKHVK